jgi:hypothetical protein
MRKIAITFFTIASVIFATSQAIGGQEISQTNCRPPELRGIGLGMTTEQVLALFPRGHKRREIQDAVEKSKSATGGQITYLEFAPATDGAGDGFAGIDSVMIGLNKGRVVDFAFQYVGQTWRSIDEWVTKLSETLKLPGSREWMVGPDEAPNKTLKCKGNEILAAIQGGGASIRVRDIDAIKETEDHANAKEERKRREFKP